jgi:hypothetical protein
MSTNWNPADIIVFWSIVAAWLIMIVAIFGGRR